MAVQVLTYALVDSVEHHGYGGFTINDAAIDSTAMSTFATAIAALSDGVPSKVKVAETLDIAYDTASCGDNPIEQRGGCRIKQLSTGRTWNIVIPAIKDTSIQYNGKYPAEVHQDAQDAVLTAFAAVSGISAADLRVVDNWLSYRLR